LLAIGLRVTCSVTAIGLRVTAIGLRVMCSVTAIGLRRRRQTRQIFLPQPLIAKVYDFLW